MKYRDVLDESANSDKTIVPENLESFYRFVYERQRVWHNRFMLELPRDEWTDDKFLKISKYTNVYRELDRGTVWWFDNIGVIAPTAKQIKKGTMPRINQVKKEIIWQTCVYRLLDKVETFDEIGLPDLALFKKEKYQKKWFGKIEDMIEGGYKVWTTAHITLQSNLHQTRLQNYKDYLNRLLVTFDELSGALIATHDIEKAFRLMMGQHGFGPFTSYEVVTDLAYLPHIYGYDIEQWANAGPGCWPGIRLIFPQASNVREYNDMMKLMRDMQGPAFKKFDIPFDDVAWKGRPLSLRNIEHSICEWRKYYAQSKGKGKARMKFNPISDRDMYGARELGIKEK